MSPENTNSYVKIDTGYPHMLLLHLSKFLKGDKEKLLDKEKFLAEYSQKYTDEDEYRILEFAYEKNIIQAFYEYDNEKLWKKRVLVEKTLFFLVKSITEVWAVILIESLMFVLGWDFNMKILRRWEMPEEHRAYFHERDKIGGFSQAEVLERIQIQNQDGVLHLNSDLTVKGKNKESDDEVSSQGKDKYVQDKTVPQRRFLNKRNEIADLSHMEQSHINHDNSIYKNMEKMLFYNKMNQHERQMLRQALKGNSRCQCELGMYYADRKTNHCDEKEAEKWYLSAAKKGFVRGFLELGRLYDTQSRGDEETKDKAIKIYKALAKDGLPTAQCILGMKYRFGDGVPEDLTKAVHWLYKAALQKHEVAIRHLADTYASVGDDDNARKWYRIGASYGDEYCQKRLH